MARTAATHGVGILVGHVVLAGACALSWPTGARAAASGDPTSSGAGATPSSRPLPGDMPSARAAVDRHTLMEFQIPAQPLRDALEQFSAATGYSGISDGALIAGRPSAGVQGRMTPEDALARLMRHTGLRARYASNDTFVVVPDTAPAGAADAGSEDAAWRERTHYYAEAQQSMRALFCRKPLLLPRNGRVALSLWLDGKGNVDRIYLLGSSGSAERDASIAARLRGVSLVSRVPAGIQQPLTMVIQPDRDGQGACNG